MRKYSLLFIVVFTCFSLMLNAANTWNWGSNEVESKGKWMALEKNVKTKKYAAAQPEADWLLQNTPDLNVALYINAVKVYEKLEKAEKDAAKKVALQDQVMALYAKRIELFGSEAKVLNRQGRVAFKYYSARADKQAGLYDFYSKIYQLNGNKTYPENMSSMLKSACMSYKLNALTKQQVLEAFGSCNELFDAQEAKYVANAKKLKKVEKYRAISNSVLAKNVEVTCEDVQTEFGEAFAANPDVKMAKVIVSLSVSNSCYSNEVFVLAAEKMISEGQGNYSLQKVVGDLHFKNGAYDKAKVSYEGAFAATEDSVKKAKIKLALAKVSTDENDFITGRDYALAALDLNPELLEAYNVIGDLYYKSAGMCNSGNKVQERSVYIAAYKMYLKGGNQTGANQMKAQFPSVEEMFLYNQKPGDVVNTGCWIKETVTLASR